MKPVILCLLAVLAFRIDAARACQFCRMAATDPESARLAAEQHAKSGGFPLDATLNRFQPAVPSPVLTAPPPTTSVATRASDLAASRLPVSATHRIPLQAAAPAPAPTANTANRWANGGLLGLLGLAGIFGWRTRRHSSGTAS